MRSYGGQRSVKQQFLGQGVGECSESRFGRRIGSIARDWEESHNGRCENDVFRRLVGLRRGPELVDP